MAIYHLTVKSISRAKGQSAVASAAYRRAQTMHDRYYEKTHDYTRKGHVIHSELTVPARSPSWVQDYVTLHETDPRLASEKFWNDVEIFEKRKDAQLAREIEFSLPIELTKAQSIQLAREFIQDQFSLRGMVADWSVHWEKGNPHVHVMLSLRELLEKGFGQKARAWNSTDLLQTWRTKWAEYANFHLQLNHHDVRIDHRSYEEQGIELVPTKHQGRALIEMQRKGISTQWMEEANSVRRENLARIAHDPNVLLKKMMCESSTFKLEKLGQELGRYINDQGKFSLHEKSMLAQSIVSPGNEDKPRVLTPETIARILKHIENHDAVFSERELAKAVSAHTEHADLFAQAVLQIKASDEIIALGPGDDGRDRFTTRRMFASENRLQAKVDRLRKQVTRPISQHRIHALLAQYEQKTGKTLTQEQKEAVLHVTGPTAIRCLVGRAGTGKSFSLGAAREVWEAQGFNVQGVALSGIAADGLTKDAGIASRTIDSFRYALTNKKISLNAHSVVVMDEAGMTDTSNMLAVLDAVEKTGAKLVAVGDPAQLQPVGAGASFRSMIERIGFIEIQTIYRQQESWQRQATVDFAAGRTIEGIAAYEAHGCVHIEKTKRDAMQTLAAHWMERRNHYQTDLSQYLVIAYENKDVFALNQLLREMRVSQGEIAPGYRVEAKAGPLSIAKGDRLVCLKNDNLLGVKNGRFATIVSVNFTESGQVIDFTVRLDGSDKLVCIDPLHYKDFAHGYCATVHKVQGVTVDHTFNYVGGAGWNKNATYVANTRHRKTCHVYASQETYRDVAKLKKGLSRYGMKDSVMDFPLAFAQRRGIDTDRLLGLLPGHLSERLSDLKTQLAERYRQWIDPKRDQQTQAVHAQEEQRVKTLTATREDARLVAAYVDKSRKVGIAWEALQKRLSEMGLTHLSYQPPQFALIASTSDYQAYQAAIQQRNAAALPLVLSPERFTKALDIYGLDLTQLQAQASSHRRHEHVLTYQRLSDRGQTVQRDRLAAQMMEDIKAYYGSLKSAGIDTKQLRVHAVQHARRALLARLSTPERQAFYAVEHYQALSKKLGQLFSDPQKNAHSTQKNYALLNERDALAANVFEKAQHATVCDAALDFFQIGRDGVVVGQDHRDNQQKVAQQTQAQARWYKLQQGAARHAIRERVQRYVHARHIGDSLSCRNLANHIVEDPKAHHGAVVNTADVPSSLWKAIRDDAKQFLRDQLFDQLTRQDRRYFLLVESYLAERHASAAAWSAVFKAKENGMPVDVQQQLAQLAKIPTTAKDHLAYAIYQNKAACQAGLAFYHIPPDALEKSAYAAQCREDVRLYQKERHVLNRSNLANIILVDPKAHHSAMLEANLSWPLLYQDKKPAELQGLFSLLSQDEKRLWRLAKRYGQVNRLVGRRYAKIVAAKRAHQTIDPKQERVAQQLLAKRDYLAHQLLSQTDQMALNTASDSTDLDTLHAYYPVHWKKLDRQAQAHKDRITHVHTWQSMYESTVRTMPNLLQDKESSQSTALHLNRYYDWLSLHEDLHVASRPLMRQLDTYTYALSSVGLSTHVFQKMIGQYGAVKQSLDKFEAQHTPAISSDPTPDMALQKRIARAHFIERGTQPIQGTLAERYLREYRGISVCLPASYRYHPGVYHAEANQKLPALVVVAKNQQKQTQAVQVIFLDKTTANKAKLNHPKLTYGSLSQGNTGVLVSAGKNSQTLAIAEGPETALSIAAADPTLRVYAVLGSGNFARAPICADTQTILFCADNDGKQSASAKKLSHAAEQFAAKGIAVWKAMPVQEKQDFNDVLKTQGVEAIKERLASATLLQPAQTIQSVRKKIQALVDNTAQYSATLVNQDPTIEQDAGVTRTAENTTSHTKVSTPEGNLEEAFSPEQIEQFNSLILRYQDQRKAFLEKPSSLLRQEFLYLRVNQIHQHPDLMRYIKQTYPKMDKNIHQLLHEQRREKKQNNGISQEQEARFIRIIQRYQFLKATHLNNPYEVSAERLSLYTQHMASHPTLMRYIQERFPKMTKNIHALSKTNHRDLSQDIDI